jgi:hypothetical protein
MTDKQPEALRLAEANELLANQAQTDEEKRSIIVRLFDDNANELRRLHEENESLLAANRDSTNHFDALMADHKKLHEVNAELLEALQGLDEAYCRSHTGLTKEERQEDHMRSLKAQKAILKAWRKPK